MDRPLVGRSILVVEDEPIVAMDVVQTLRAAGATVSRARTVSDALSQVDSLGLSAAVLDHSLSDGDSSQICKRLDERNIPFVVYSGYDYIEGPCKEGEHLRKPVRPELLVAAVADVLEKRST